MLSYSYRTLWTQNPSGSSSNFQNLVSSRIEQILTFQFFGDLALHQINSSKLAILLVSSNHTHLTHCTCHLLWTPSYFHLSLLKSGPKYISGKSSNTQILVINLIWQSPYTIPKFLTTLLEPSQHAHAWNPSHLPFIFPFDQCMHPTPFPPPFTKLHWNSTKPPHWPLQHPQPSLAEMVL
jgi:hypothetical protein